MSVEADKVELALTYGQPGGLFRTTDPKKYSALIQRMHNCYSVLLTPVEIGVDLLKAPGLCRVRIKLTDGTLLEGEVRAVQHNYFELVEDQGPK